MRLEKNIQIEMLLEKSNDQKLIEKAKTRQRKKEQKLIPFRCNDGKTTFLCKNPERGAKAVAAYERKLKQYK
jgi:hypothetical protein